MNNPRLVGTTGKPIIIYKVGDEVTIEKLNEKEILQYALENNIIDLSYVQEKIEMAKRNTILKKYGSCIWYSEKEQTWYCHIPDETKKSGRKKVKRKKKEDIEEIVYQFYKGQEQEQKAENRKENIKFKDLFDEFIRYKSKEVTACTIKRMMADWHKFYVGTEFIEKPLTQITKIDVDNFLNNALDEYKLKPKAFYNMCGLLKQTLQYAIDAEYIDKNPYRTKINKKKFAEHGKKPAESEVYQSDEKNKIIQEMERRLKNNPKNTAPLAVILDFELGTRKGEILAISESDIEDGWIHIHRQVVEKFDISDIDNIKSTGFEVVNYTKSSDGDRWLPLSAKAIETINRVQDINRQYNECYEDFLFVRNGQIMSPDVVDAQLIRGCKYIGIKVKTMHKIRKTYGSMLLHNGVNISAVKDMLGHADESTTMKHYIYNTMTDKETKEAVLNALSGTPNSKVTKSDQNIISFQKSKRAKTLETSRLSAL